MGSCGHVDLAIHGEWCGEWVIQGNGEWVIQVEWWPLTPGLIQLPPFNGALLNELQQDGLSIPGIQR